VTEYSVLIFTFWQNSTPQKKKKEKRKRKRKCWEGEVTLDMSLFWL